MEVVDELGTVDFGTLEIDRSADDDYASWLDNEAEQAVGDDVEPVSSDAPF
jgi:hypothetical protein